MCACVNVSVRMCEYVSLHVLVDMCVLFCLVNLASKPGLFWVVPETIPPNF